MHRSGPLSFFAWSAAWSLALFACSSGAPVLLDGGDDDDDDSVADARPDATRPGTDAGRDAARDSGRRPEEDATFPDPADADADAVTAPLTLADIRDVQQGVIPTGSRARIAGVVTAVDPSSSFFFVQEPTGTPEYSGIAVYLGTDSAFSKPAVGVTVTLEGTVKEFTAGGSPLTRTDLEDVTLLETDEPVALPAPVLVADPSVLAAEATAEPYEGVLVRIEEPFVLTEPDQFATFTVTGNVFVESRLYAYPLPKIGDQYEHLTGVLDYNHKHYEILPRSAEDAPQVPPPPTALVSIGPATLDVFGAASGHDAGERTGVLAIQLNHAAPLGGFQILLESADPDSVQIADEVLVPEGQDRAYVRVRADGAVATTVTITATDADVLATSQVNVVLAATAPAAGDLVMSEILYAPAANGDANCDGTRDATKDELVELVNLATHPVELGGVSLWDASAYLGAAPRYKFAPRVLGPGEAVTVFGGARSGLGGAGAWCVTPVAATLATVGDALAFSASSDGLSLGNTGDTLTLTLLDKAQKLDEHVYGEHDAEGSSLERSGDAWVKHDALPGHAADRPFTPGTRPDGRPFASVNPPG